MAIPESYARFTDERTIQAVKDRYKSEMSRIADNRTLNDQGRRIAEARAFTDAQQRLDGLQEEFQQKVNTERSRLERQLFGPGSTDPAQIVAHRDALERADRIDTSQKAQQAWDRAKFSGDTGLQNAIMSKATRYGWTDVVEAHIAEHPSAGRAVQELRSLPEPKGLGAVAVFNIPRPKWAGMGDKSYIAAVANQSDYS